MAKAQIKMFETVAVLVVFFFLLITGSMFYFNAQTSALKKEKVQAGEQYAFQIVLKSLYMPELDCSFLVTQKDNCIDAIKLKQFAFMLQNETVRNDYFMEFGYASITVNQLFPSNTPMVKLYENIPPEYVDKLVTNNPILIYNAWNDIYLFGVMEVAVYVT